MRTFNSETTRKFINSLFGNDGVQIITWENDYTIAKRISEMFNVPFNSLCGVYDTEEKLICIWVEVSRNPDLKAFELAEKYAINKNYMLKRLREMRENIPNDPILMLKALAVMAEFKIN